ncbi:YicC family protein [Alkalicaulis satelles]|uniref:YicC family protein n=1 Tax=Alkalicaulis satelles TaxID=2609175 RepID=A0A5M6ZJF7_9PROT|nr:YicC/YloC family endoribonuclease [Alkalicaulis satelles]KAA5804946.1 YicC family protein [Alkalicaulis satelles]
MSAKPLSGMTGFGRGASEGVFGSVIAEARSVNGKGLDVRLRLPAGLDALEIPLREAVRARFQRGSVTLTLTWNREAAEAAVRIDEARLDAYARAARVLSDQGLAAQASAGELMALKGVILSDDAETVSDETLEALNAAALAAADAALAALQGAREAEGAAMGAVLSGHLDEIGTLTRDAAGLDAASPEAIKARLEAKFNELLPSGLEPERLAQEAAMMAVKADIREELDRLAAHVTEARTLLKAGSPCGRKLDFLSQEFNREANTLCSKSSDPALTRIGLALKAAVDRLREQVQNVE